MNRRLRHGRGRPSPRRRLGQFFGRDRLGGSEPAPLAGAEFDQARNREQEDLAGEENQHQLVDEREPREAVERKLLER